MKIYLIMKGFIAPEEKNKYCQFVQGFVYKPPAKRRLASLRLKETTGKYFYEMIEYELLGGSKRHKKKRKKKAVYEWIHDPRLLKFLANTS